MSVWCSRLVIDGDGFEDDGPGPLIYHGSHVIPSADGERGGSVATAHLPGFLTRDGYDEGPEDGDVWPFLRVSVRPAQRPDWDAWERLRALADRLDPDDSTLAADVRSAADCEDTIVLDHAQVVALRDELSDWLARIDYDCPTRTRTEETP